VTGQLPLLPPLFWLLAKLAELWPTEACLPAGQRAVESAEEISDEGAPEPILRAAGPGRNDRG
jgi:hypothetical protein